MCPESDYFKVALPKSFQDWHKGWFYAPDPAEGGDLPSFVNTPPKHLKSWKSVESPSKNTRVLIAAMKGFINHGLTGEQVLKRWLKRRVQPLATRAHPMNPYEGPKDPTRMASGELPEDELRAHIHTSTDLELEKILLHVAMEPFCLSNPPSDVSYSSQVRSPLP